MKIIIYMIKMHMSSSISEFEQNNVGLNQQYEAITDVFNAYIRTEHRYFLSRCNNIDSNGEKSDYELIPFMFFPNIKLEFSNIKIISQFDPYQEFFENLPNPKCEIQEKKMGDKASEEVLLNTSQNNSKCGISAEFSDSEKSKYGWQMSYERYSLKENPPLNLNPVLKNNKDNRGTEKVPHIKNLDSGTIKESYFLRTFHLKLKYEIILKLEDADISKECEMIVFSEYNLNENYHKVINIPEKMKYMLYSFVLSFPEEENTVFMISRNSRIIRFRNTTNHNLYLLVYIDPHYKADEEFIRIDNILSMETYKFINEFCRLFQNICLVNSEEKRNEKKCKIFFELKHVVKTSQGPKIEERIIETESNMNLKESYMDITEELCRIFTLEDKKKAPRNKKFGNFFFRGYKINENRKSFYIVFKRCFWIFDRFCHFRIYGFD